MGLKYNHVSLLVAHGGAEDQWKYWEVYEVRGVYEENEYTRAITQLQNDAERFYTWYEEDNNRNGTYAPATITISTQAANLIIAGLEAADLHVTQADVALTDSGASVANIHPMCPFNSVDDLYGWTHTGVTLC